MAAAYSSMLLFVIVASFTAVATAATCPPADCVAKWPKVSDPSPTCASLRSKYADGMTCLEAAGCVDSAAALYGNCFVSNLFEYVTPMQCGTGDKPSVECYNFKSANYNLSYSCDTPKVLSCELYRLEGKCDAVKMQKYLDCYKGCAANDFTRSFYSGTCQASYRLTKCDWDEGTDNFKQCYGMKTVSGAPGASLAVMAVLLCTAALAVLLG